MAGTLFPTGLHFLKRKSARSFAVYYLLQFFSHLETKNSDRYLHILMHGFCVSQRPWPIIPDHG